MIRAICGWVISVAVALLFLMPLLWMVQATFRPDDHIFSGGFAAMFEFGNLSLQNYADAWRRADLYIGLVNSFIQVGGIILAGLVINSLAAYAFARMEFPGRGVLFATVVILIILPVEVLGVPLFMTVRTLGLTGSRVGVMAALILPFAAKAFNIYFLRQHFLSLPREMEEAAIVDGAGPLAVFWRVALLSIKPALATVVVLDVIVHWSDFFWPLIVVTGEEQRTIQLSLKALFTQDPVHWGDIMACAVIATIPVILVFTFFQRYVVASQLGSGIK